MSQMLSQAPEKLAELLERAVGFEASDLYLDPVAEGLRLRVRVDGVFRLIDQLPEQLGRELRNRVKVLARLVLHREDIPQEGVFTQVLASRSVQVRVSVLPTVLGEKIALRLMDVSAPRRQLQNLGFEPAILAALVQAGSHRDGLVLVCGPSGSGKTTTIYALLQAILRARPDRVNVLSLEDPVEVLVPGVSQVSLNLHAGLDYVSAAKAALRQDPEVLAVSEIRDPATAEAVLRASFTGHLVLSSLHCARAVEAPRRLEELGLPPAQVAGSLRGVLAQNLVRTLCSACKGKGCASCSETGWKGRALLAEWVDFREPELQALVRAGASADELAKAVKKGPGTTLRQAAENLVAKDLTTFDELRLGGMEC